MPPPTAGLLDLLDAMLRHGYIVRLSHGWAGYCADISRAGDEEISVVRPTMEYLTRSLSIIYENR